MTYGRGTPAERINLCQKCEAVIYGRGVWRDCGFDAVVNAMMTARSVASHRILQAFPEDLKPIC
jgi:NMD protein affecting ribosome stability and mRNA decay